MSEKKEIRNLIDYIGDAAMLEQVAEECMELGFACQKLARMMRGENKVHGRTKEELIDSVHEEMADIYISMEELLVSPTFKWSKVYSWMEQKNDRMQERLAAEEKQGTGNNCEYTLEINASIDPVVFNTAPDLPAYENKVDEEKEEPKKETTDPSPAVSELKKLLTDMVVSLISEYLLGGTNTNKKE